MKLSLRAMQAAPLVGEDRGLSPRGRAVGVALALAGAGLFSFKAIFVKLAYAQGELEPITLLFLRFGFALPVYVVILVWSLRKGAMPRRTAVQAFALGLLGYHLCAWVDFAGLQYITAQLERLLLFTYPAFVVVLGAVFFGHKLRVSGLAAIALAYCGIAIVFVGGDIATGTNVPLGAALILACALLFAVFQLLAKPRIDAMGSVRFTCVAMLGASAGVATHYGVQTYLLGQGDPVGTFTGELLWIGFALGVVCTILPSFFTNIALGRIGAQGVAVLAMIGPVVTIVAAVGVLGEPFGWVDGLGTGVTLSGIALYTLVESRATVREIKTRPTPVTSQRDTRLNPASEKS